MAGVDELGPEYVQLYLVTKPTHDKEALAFMGFEQATQRGVNKVMALVYSSEKAARSDDSTPFAFVQIDVPNKKATVSF